MGNVKKFKKIGIDVSYHQGNIDWKLVKKAGIQFAFIRLGYCNSDGSIVIDKKFKKNIKGASKVGIDVGCYLYSYATSVKAAKKAAQGMKRIIRPYRITYPIVFDIEDAKYQKNVSKKRKKSNTDLTLAFLKEIEAAGYYAMFYTNKNFVETFLDREALKDYDFWIAKYGSSSPKYNKPYGIWQYTNKGKIPGIKGNVDLNYSYHNYANIIKKHHLNHL